jgi:hypothetical protein
MSRWDEFLKIAASIELKWPKLREVMVAQSIMESGRCTTELSTKHLNPFGMHYVNFNGSLCTKVQYYTDSEPVQDDGKRWGWFAQYPSYENAIRGWENWFLKWEHYQAIWKNNPEYLQDPEKFLYAISPHYCPPGMRPEWAKIHGGLNYPQYILQKLLPEAKALLKSITPSAYKTLKQGDRGEDVLQLQKELNARIGSFLVCDGIYGQKTYEAVKKAEANLGLVEDGVADPIFREKLQTLKPLESNQVRFYHGRRMGSFRLQNSILNGCALVALIREETPQECFFITQQASLERESSTMELRKVMPIFA